MTTLKLQRRDRENSRLLIVRGFAGKPAKLYLVSENPELVVVKGLTGGESLGLNPHWVFEWDELLYSELAGAFERGDDRGVESLWGRAVPIVKAT